MRTRCCVTEEHSPLRSFQMLEGGTKSLRYRAISSADKTARSFLSTIISWPLTRGRGRKIQVAARSAAKEEVVQYAKFISLHRGLPPRLASCDDVSNCSSPVNTTPSIAATR